jgi:hypothetical protein
MRIKILIVLLVILAVGTSFTFKQFPLKQGKLLARYDMADSGTTMTLEKANKNAEEAENNRKMMIPFYFSPLVIILIAVAIRRRKKKLSL